MAESTTVGLDLAKNVLQAHGADASWQAVLRKKLKRDQVVAFVGQLRPWVVTMEACGAAHFWGREIGKEPAMVVVAHQTILRRLGSPSSIR